MSQQTDILASAPLTATGLFKDQSGNALMRTRVRTIYAVCGATAGAVVLRDGGATGSVIATIDTPANTTAGYVILPLPGEGLLFKSGNLHGTVTNTTSMVVYYG